MVFAALSLVFLGVPLYLLRRPSSAPEDSTAASAGAGAEPIPGIVRSTVDAGASEERSVRIGDPRRVKCSASSGQRGNEGAMSDALPVIEEALRRAIKAEAECAPKTGEAGTINFVANIDFTSRRLHLFPGQSGIWKGPQAKRAVACVERAMPEIRWDSIRHQYRFYTLAMLASYPKPSGTDLIPSFE